MKRKPFKGKIFFAKGQGERLGCGRPASGVWNQFKTDFAPGTHIRIHPLLDWTELNIWEYIERETYRLHHCILTVETESVTDPLDAIHVLFLWNRRQRM